MKKTLVCLLLLSGLASCSQKAVKDQSAPVNGGSNGKTDAAAVIAETVLSNAGKLAGGTVAVVNFTDIDGRETEEGKILSEQVVTRLATGNRIKVVERERLSKILDEQKLGMSGLTDEKEDSIGKLLNADGILSGIILAQDGAQEISVRMVGVKSGEILAAVSVRRTQNSGAGLTTEQKKRIEQENRLLQEMKNKDPKRYEVNQDVRSEMRDLGARDQALFNKTLALVRHFERVRVNRPGTYLLLTEPEKSRMLERLRRNKPDEFAVISKGRKGVAFVMKNVPSYGEKIVFDRVDAMQRFKNPNLSR